MSESEKVETLTVTVCAPPEALLDVPFVRRILNVRMDKALKAHAAVEVGKLRRVEWRRADEFQPRDRPAEVPSDAVRFTMTARAVRHGTA